MIMMVVYEDLLLQQQHSVAGVVVNLVNLTIPNDLCVHTSPTEAVIEVEVVVNLENSMTLENHWVHHRTNHRGVIHPPKNKDILQKYNNSKVVLLAARIIGGQNPVDQIIEVVAEATHEEEGQRREILRYIPYSIQQQPWKMKKMIM